MLYFPQLETRTAAQYPLRRVRRERVVRHESPDGRTRSYYDSGASRVEWKLSYDGLTDAERQAIDELFAACEGRLQTFLFIDPAANLLRWSEDYFQFAWTNAPLLGIAAGSADPWGGTRASDLTNNTSIAQGIAQTAPLPGSLHYCLSAFVRGEGQRFRLRIDSGGVVEERAFTASAGWQRYFVSARPGTGAEAVTFSLQVEPNTALSVCGMHADGQPAPAGYRKTTSRCGVYSNARFSQDTLAWAQIAPNHHAAEIEIESRT